MNLFVKFVIVSLSLCVTTYAGAQNQEVPDAPTNYPAGELGKMVKLGENILNHTNTNSLTKDWVNNELQCKSCHLPGQDGRPGAGKGMGTLIGSATAFPAWSRRAGTVQTLRDRINDCYIRSMNGDKPITDSKASIAMVAYVTWLSNGLPIKMNPKRPVTPYNNKKYATGQKIFAAIQKKATHQNYLQGKKIFQDRCAVCHGKNGAGIAGIFPPLWGKSADGKWLSYNAGAGMDNLKKAPVWVQSNMPLHQGGTLNNHEAADVVLYIDAQPRASFSMKDHLLPKSKIGYVNAKISTEKHTVRSNFKDFGLDIDKIRGDSVIK